MNVPYNIVNTVRTYKIRSDCSEYMDCSDHNNDLIDLI